MTDLNTYTFKVNVIFTNGAEGIIKKEYRATTLNDAVRGSLQYVESLATVKEIQSFGVIMFKGGKR